jgi:hypothetical protein
MSFEPDAGSAPDTSSSAPSGDSAPSEPMVVHDVDTGGPEIVVDTPASREAQQTCRGCDPMRRDARGSRMRHRVFRAFVAMAGDLVSTGMLVRWVWPRRLRFRTEQQYRRVRAAAAEIADPVGYQHRGRCSSSPGGLLWKLRDGMQQ